MKPVIIEAKKICKQYRMSRENTVPALQGVDLTVRKGDFTAIIGPSGCGKSTLMHILGLLDRPDSGELMIDGVHVSQMKERQAVRFRAKKIGFIFQGFNLLPTLTAVENVVLAARYGGYNRRSAQKMAVALLAEMGLGDRIHHKPNQLSGGQQQRVAIARALINKPSIILADEPTGELDSHNSLEIIEMLKKLNRDNEQTFLIVTHNLEVAESCRHTVRLRDGRNEG